MSPLNRYHRFDWQGVPQPGELEYLTGVTKRAAGREKWLAHQTVNPDTLVNAGFRHDAPTVKPTGI